MFQCDVEYGHVLGPLLIVLWLFREFLTRALHLKPLSPAQETLDRADQHHEARRLDRLIPAVIATCFYLLAFYRLGIPNEMVFDEVHHAHSAMEFVAGQNPDEWTHPHLTKLLIAGSIIVWGGQFDPGDGVYKQDNKYPLRIPVAWRFASVVFGTLSLVVLYKLTREMTKDRWVATLAMLFLAMDGVFFVLSRVAMTNIFCVFFVLLASLGTWRYLETGRVRHLLLTGFGLGCGIACRWSSLYMYALTGLALLIYQGWKMKQEAKSGGIAWGGHLKWAGVMVTAFLVIPLIIYALAYTPFVLQGEQGTYAQKLFSYDYNGHGWGKVISQQKDMWEYHSGMTDTHPYSSPWWSWPLMIRPVWFYWMGEKGIDTGVWCIGNVFIWWALLPAFLSAGFLAWREKRLALALVVLLGLGFYLLWGVKARTLNFTHYMFESIPFACIALAYLFSRFWRESGTNEEDGAPNREAGRMTTDQVAIVVYGTLIVFWFVFFYPLLSALPVTESFYGKHLWVGRPWV